MDILNIIFSFVYQILESCSFLILAAIGMAIIYGMMGITNLAQGEFILIGAYSSSIFVNKLGVPLPVAILGGAAVTGIFGLIVDRVIMRRLYDRPMDSVVITWGISIVLAQACFLVFGPTYTGVSIPLGAISVGGRDYPVYRFLLMIIAALLLAGMYWLFHYTRFGLHSRATMQSRTMANAMGVNANKINALTFMMGSALAGLCGGLYMPTMSLTPNYGQNFLVESFVTVLVGGGEPLTGTILAGGALGSVQGFLSLAFNTYYGKIGILLMAIVFIRILPNGFSGAHNTLKMKKKVKAAMKAREAE